VKIKKTDLDNFKITRYKINSTEKALSLKWTKNWKN